MEIYFPNNHNQLLYGKLNGATGDHVVLTVHPHRLGFASRSTNVLSRKLKEHGVPCFQFSQAGHKKSDGELHEHTVTSALEDACSAIDMLRAEGFKKFSVYGTSTGALAAMAVAEKRDIEFIALKSPSFNYGERIDYFALCDRVKVHDKHFFMYEDPGGVNFPMAYAFYADARKYDWQRPSVPTFVVHGTEDVTFPLSEVREWTAGVHSLRLVEIEGSTHWWTKEGSNRVTQIIADWIANSIKVESPPKAIIQSRRLDYQRLGTSL